MLATFFLILMYLLPAFACTYMAFEMDVHRNTRDRVAAAIMMSLASFFGGELVRALLPLEYSFSIFRHWSGPSIVLALCFTAHLYSLFVRLNERMPQWVVYAFAYTPFLILGPLFQTPAIYTIYSGVEKVGIWNKFIISPTGYFIVVSLVCVYASTLVFMVSLALRNAATYRMKRKYRMLMYGTFLLTLWLFVFSIAAELLPLPFTLPSLFYVFGAFFWLACVRVVMVRFDFLSSDERKFRILFDTSPMSIMLLDRTGQIHELNPVARRMYGFPLDKGDHFLQVLSEDIRQAALELFQSQFDSRTSHRDWVFTISTVDGRRLTLSVDTDYMEIDDDIFRLDIVRDVTEMKASEEKVTRLAYTDSLTQIPNRLQFYRRFHELTEATASQDPRLAVLILDLDRFKQINDVLGHHVGDQLLQHVASSLAGLFREPHLVARLGGDEFILLLTDIRSREQAERMGQQVLDTLREPVLIGDREYHLTSSIGISLYPEDGHDADTLMKHADNAMYRAKGKGRNMVCVYDLDMNREAAAKFELESGLRLAIERGELLVHYQPQADLVSGRVIGMEALVRWQPPGRELVFPGDFIGAAEECGLIVPIGRQVLEMACRQNKLWLDQGHLWSLSVNVSAQQFLRPQFAEEVKQVLEETKLPPVLLCLEITETIALQDIERTQEQLQVLVSLGVSVALDDFGTGYSSLGLIRQLPVHQIKIDRSFVRDMTHDSVSRTIVEAMLAIAHSVGVQAVAEGVETEEQRSLLARSRCHVIQGYWLSKPLPAEEISARFGRCEEGA